MKKRMKKLVSLALATAMATGLLTACGGSASNTDVDLKATTDEYVELKMYLLGDRTPDFDEVYGKINEAYYKAEGQLAMSDQIVRLKNPKE